MSLELPRLRDKEEVRSFLRRVADRVDPKSSKSDWYGNVLPDVLEDVPQIPSVTVLHSDLYDMDEFYKAATKEWPDAPRLEQDFWLDRFAPMIGGVSIVGFEPKQRAKLEEEGRAPEQLERQWIQRQREMRGYGYDISDVEKQLPLSLQRYAWRIEIPAEHIAAQSNRFRLSFRQYIAIRGDSLGDYLKYRSQAKQSKKKKSAFALNNLANSIGSRILGAADSVGYAVREWLKSEALLEQVRSRTAESGSVRAAGHVAPFVAGAALGAFVFYGSKR